MKSKEIIHLIPKGYRRVRFGERTKQNDLVHRYFNSGGSFIPIEKSNETIGNRIAGMSYAFLRKK